MSHFQNARQIFAHAQSTKSNLALMRLDGYQSKPARVGDSQIKIRRGQANGKQSIQSVLGNLGW